MIHSYLNVLVELARTSDVPVLNFKLVKNLSIEEIKAYSEENKK